MGKIPLELDKGDAEGAAEELDWDDPIVAECLKDALGPYVGLLTPEEVIEHKRFLTIFITTHPEARPIYERLREGRRQRPATAMSGDVAKDGAPVEGTDAILGSGTEGGRR
jgi:hypothetical protein